MLRPLLLPPCLPFSIPACSLSSCSAAWSHWQSRRWTSAPPTISTSLWIKQKQRKVILLNSSYQKLKISQLCIHIQLKFNFDINFDPNRKIYTHTQKNWKLANHAYMYNSSSVRNNFDPITKIILTCNKKFVCIIFTLKIFRTGKRLQKLNALRISNLKAR